MIGGDDFIIFTNVSNYDRQVFALVKRGYGSVSEISLWDSDLFLDAIEFENINNHIERHLYKG